MRFSINLRSLAGCLLLIGLVGACKNNGTDPTPANTTSGRKCVVNALDYKVDVNVGSSVVSMSVNAALTYNASNQLSTITTRYVIGGFGTFSNTDDITYSTGKIEVKTNASAQDMDGILSSTYTLNGAGLITKKEDVMEGSGTTSLTLTTSYEYDRDGYRVRDVLSDGSAVAYAYANGNLTTVTTFDSKGAKEDVFALTYYEDRRSNTELVGGASAESAFQAAGLFGKASRNPVKTVTAQTTPGQPISFTYVYDADNNIITATQTQPTGGQSNPVVFRVNYAYSCR